MPRENEKEAIEMIQTYLRQLSYHDADIPAIAIDGVWGNETAEAVKAFQRKYELPQNGRVDLITWELLLSKYLESVHKYSTAEKLTFFPENNQGLSYGVENSGTGVGILQLVLRELSRLYPTFGDIQVTELYDPATVKAVIEFQRRNNLPPSGRVDKETWNRMAQQYNFLHYEFTE